MNFFTLSAHAFGTSIITVSFFSLMGDVMISNPQPHKPPCSATDPDPVWESMVDLQTAGVARRGWRTMSDHRVVKMPSSNRRENLAALACLRDHGTHSPMAPIARGSHRYLLIVAALSLSSPAGAAGKLFSTELGKRSTPASNSPTHFYRRLAEAITDLEGHATLYFNPGVWETRSVAAGTVQWRIADGTTADILVKYRNRALESASITFDKPIHVWFPVMNGVSFSITTLKYNQNGDIVDDDRKPDNEHSSHFAGSARLNRIFSISTSPEGLLKGQLLTNIDSLLSCDTNNKNCKATPSPMIYEVALRRTPQSPAFLVAIGPLAGGPSEVTLPLARSGGAPNYLALSAGSSLALDDVEYYVDEHYLHGTLSKLDLQLSGGQISTGDLSLLIASGSHFKTENLNFTHDGATGQNVVDADHAYLEAGLGAASRIQIATASASQPDVESFVTLKNGSLVKLRDVTFRQDDKSSTTTVTWSNSSRQDLNILTGRLNLGNGSFINLGNTTLGMNLSGTWEAGHSPQVSATDVQLDAQLTGGELSINTASVLRLGPGQLVGDHLSFDSTTRPVLRGTFTQFTFEILAKTTVAFPGAITLVTRSGGSFSLDPAGTGLKLGTANAYPVGRYLLSLPFSAFDNSGSKIFELQDGSASLPVESLADGTIQNPQTPNLLQWEIIGNMLITPHGGTALTIASSVKGNFKAPKGGPPSFAGTFSGNARAGFQLPFVTPGIGMQGQPPVEGDVHIYPVSAKFTVPTDFTIPVTSFSIGGDGRAVVDLELNLPFVLKVDGGTGEHQHSDDPGSADGTHGPDGVHGWQEVFQTTHVCTMHLYVAPKDQAGGLKAHLSLTSSDLTLDVVELHFDNSFSDPQDYRKDGCDGTQLLTLLGAVLGGLPGTVGGFVLGHKVDNKIDDIIRERIGEFSKGFTHSWHMQFRG